jgi:UDP-N-acetylmuramate--alanine ligase
MDATVFSSVSASAHGWSAPRDFRDAPVHFVGIGGSGMAALAAVLLRRGARVTGTDRTRSMAVENLERDGARIHGRDDSDVLAQDVRWVVASAAIPAENAELVEARRRGLPVLKYAEMLGELVNPVRGLAVAGTHGKSTTSAWLAYTLRAAGLDPSFVVGAVSTQLGGASDCGHGAHFVVEACEYDRSFLQLRPEAALILNIEEDHLDCYADLEAIQRAFSLFAAQVSGEGLLVINGDDPICRAAARASAASVETFGFDSRLDWSAVELELSRGRYAFDVRRGVQRIGRVHLGLAGRHNVANGLGMAALAAHAGADWESIRNGLENFQGVARRLQVHGTVGGVTVVDDYAHHPTEIRVTLTAARERFQPQRIWCIFQPHQYARTRWLLDGFAGCFATADRVVVPRIYGVRDSQHDRDAVSASDLVEKIAASGTAAEHVVRAVRPGDLVVTMGAGDIGKVAHELVGRLRGDLPT